MSFAIMNRAVELFKERHGYSVKNDEDLFLECIGEAVKQIIEVRKC